jgi:hypothetical protein
MKVFEGSSWVAAYASLSGALIAASNLADLTSASAARTNLGLGTVATTASTAYATAAQGTKADNALPKAGGAMTGAITTNSTFDGRDVATDGTKLDTIATSANNYSHPSSHPVSFITGLQTALNGKVDDSQVLTNVPSGALFTDTNTVFSGNYNSLSNRPSLFDGNYNSLSNKPTIPTNNNQLSNGAGFTTYSANQGLNTNSSPTFSTLNAGTIGLAPWSITESGGVLYFKHNGSNKMKLDSSGNITVTGNVTAYGSV